MFENEFYCQGHGWWVEFSDYKDVSSDKDCPNHDGCEMSTLEVDA